MKRQIKYVSYIKFSQHQHDQRGYNKVNNNSNNNNNVDDDDDDDNNDNKFEVK